MNTFSSNTSSSFFMNIKEAKRISIDHILNKSKENRSANETTALMYDYDKTEKIVGKNKKSIAEILNNSLKQTHVA